MTKSFICYGSLCFLVLVLPVAVLDDGLTVVVGIGVRLVVCTGTELDIGTLCDITLVVDVPAARREHQDPYPIQMHTNLPHVKDVFGVSLPVPVTENDMNSPSQRSFHELTFHEIQNEVKLLSQEDKDFDEDPLSFEEAIDVLMEGKFVNITLFIQFYWKKGKGCKLRFMNSLSIPVILKLQ